MIKLSERKWLSCRFLPFFAFFLVTAAFGCGQKSTSSNGEDDVLIAEVENKKLFSSEVDKFIPQGLQKEDSLQFVRTYTEQWIKESLLLVEAEKNLPKDLELDRLVRDYRSSLVITNYELLLTESRLDTLVAEEEIQAYYEANKDQYQLEYTILRCRFLKISQGVTPKDKEFTDKNWRSNNPKDKLYLERVCREFGDVCYFDEDQWHKFDHIKSLFPSGVLQETMVGNQQEFTFRDGNHYYYLKVLERFSSQELAPLSFIRDQAKKFILHQRKRSMMQRIKDELYEKEIVGKKVKVYL
jgi:hypothetical protein